MPKASSTPPAESSPAPEPDTTPSPAVITITGGGAHPDLPAGLLLGQGTYQAHYLADGRLYVHDLPPAVVAAFYLDLASPPAPADPAADPASEEAH